MGNHHKQMVDNHSHLCYNSGTVTSKQKMKQKFKKLVTQNTLIASILVLGLGFAVAPFAMADRFDEQIAELNQQNSENLDKQRNLEVQASSFQEKINALASQISALEKQIRSNEAKSTELKAQIKAAEEELQRQRDLLGENIRAMYLEGDISTLEMLASSKDLSDFVDKQQYRSSVKDNIKRALDKVNALKQELNQQKRELDQLIADQKGMQDVLDSQRAEQNRLLALNASQRAAIDAEIKDNYAEIEELRRQQAIENARFIGTAGTGANCGGGYPGSADGQWGVWGCNYPLDYSVDPWGMYNRECVSYTAYKVAASGRHMPYWGGYGNANQWDDNARAMGIPVDTNPRVGDVAVSNGGYYGHVMYVEHVYPDGKLLISQYNAGWDGRYSEAVIDPWGLVFIHFP